MKIKTNFTPYNNYHLAFINTEDYHIYLELSQILKQKNIDHFPIYNDFEALEKLNSLPITVYYSQNTNLTSLRKRMLDSQITYIEINQALKSMKNTQDVDIDWRAVAAIAILIYLNQDDSTNKEVELVKDFIKIAALLAVVITVIEIIYILGKKIFSHKEQESIEKEKKRINVDELRKRKSLLVPPIKNTARIISMDDRKLEDLERAEIDIDYIYSEIEDCYV